MTSSLLVQARRGPRRSAHSLAPTGKKILILERGEFLVRSKDNWNPEKVFRQEIYHTPEKWLTKDGGEFRPGQAYLVGGNTKVFGAALLRLREKDFEEISYDDGVSPAWPITYEELEPYYQEAERLYFVHGERGEDPTEPPASKPFAYPKLSQEPRMLEVFNQLKGQGLKPFHLPIGVQRFEDNIKDSPCIRCNTCDGFPCMVNAKGDAERSCLIHALAHPNVTLMTGAKTEKLRRQVMERRVTACSCLSRRREQNILRRRRSSFRPAPSIRPVILAEVGQCQTSKRSGQFERSSGSELHVPQQLGHDRHRSVQEKSDAFPKNIRRQ